MYKLAVFDIDGTLIDTEKTGVESLVVTIKELLGTDIPYEEAYKYFGIPSNKVAGLLGYEDSKLFGERWEENFIALSHYIRPFPGVLEALKRIKATGIATGVVTSRNKMEFGYDDHLRSLASKALGTAISPSEVIFFGDTGHDYACARDAGCDFALADWKGRDAGEILFRYKFSSAEEMESILAIHGE